MFKTYYEGHDNAYKNLRKNENRIGWAEEYDYQEFILTIQPMISQAFSAENNNFHDFPQSGNLLEVGCGAGNLSIYFAEKGYNCTGIDISETAINWAKEKAQEKSLEIEFVKGDVTNLSFLGNERFDIVIDGRCLHCIIGEDRKKFYQQIKNVMKENGRFIVYTMTGESIGEKYKSEFDPQTKCLIKEFNGDKIATRYIGTKNDLLSEVETNGFEVLEYYYRKRKRVDSFDDLIILLGK